MLPEFVVAELLILLVEDGLCVPIELLLPMLAGHR